MWGIEHTSLIHAYLLVSVTPIAIAAGTWLLRRPISRGEIGGTALATMGAGLLNLGPAAKGNQARLQLAARSPTFLEAQLRPRSHEGNFFLPMVTNSAHFYQRREAGGRNAARV